MNRSFQLIEDSSIRIRRTTKSDVEYVLQAESEPDNTPYIVQWTRDQHIQSLSAPDIAHLIFEDTHSDRRVRFSILRGLNNERGPIKPVDHAFQQLARSARLLRSKRAINVEATHKTSRRQRAMDGLEVPVV